MVNFWNGNKSPARQNYELELLELLLNDSDAWGPVANDVTDYPKAEDEGAILEKGSDLLVTVAGNKKFEGKPFIEIPTPLCRGLIGWRLLIVSKDKLQDFTGVTVSDLKQKTVGVPDTWVDAELFRHNGFNVLEQGSLEDMLGWVTDGTVDFITLGVNEAQDILGSYPEKTKDLVIEPTLVIYYPFPLVFYINEQQAELAKWLGDRLALDGHKIDAVFEKHYGSVASDANLSEREVVELQNPLLPKEYEMLLTKQLYTRHT